MPGTGLCATNSARSRCASRRSRRQRKVSKTLPPVFGVSWGRPGGEDMLTWLLTGVRKDSAGFMARYFDRSISLNVTRRLLDTWIRPTHMTVLSTLIGLLGAAQFVYSTPRHAIAGALLI